MALQTFTAGQVLTAAQVTALQANDYNQTVNNYTDSRTLAIGDLGDRVVMNKATATTITVNTGIFAAGDTLWIHNIGAGICTITAGTATVTTSGSLVLAQNAGGTLYFTSTGAAIFFPTVASSAQGLTLLNTTSFSGVLSQSINNVFSATYTNYLVIFNFKESADVGSSVRLRASGSDVSTSNYVIRELNASGGSVVVASGTDTSFGCQISGGANETTTAILNIFNPFVAEKTSIFLRGTNTGIASYTDKNVVFNLTTSFDGLSLIRPSGTITGTIKTFGYN